MKLLSFSRQSILRAIRAACLAFCLAAAAARAAHAQSVTSDGQGNVNIIGNGSNFQYNGVTPVVLAPGGTLTIGTSPANTTITDTTVASIIALTEPAVVVNNGSLTVTNTALPPTAIEIAAGASSTAISVTNATGATLVAHGDTGHPGQDIVVYASGTAPVTVTNEGTLVATSGGNGNGAEAIDLSVSGVLTVSNSGSITSDGDGIVAAQGAVAAASGTITNTGTITAGLQGIYGYSINTASGSAFDVNNINNITVTGVGQTSSSSGIYANNFNGSATVTASGGAISVTSSTASAYGIQASNQGAGDTTVHVTGGSITANGAAGATGVEATSSGGNIFLDNSQVITATGAAGVTYGINASDSAGSANGLTISNTGSVSATENAGEFAAIGINALGGGAVTITNSGSGNVTGTSGSSSGYGIQAISSGGNVSVTNSSTGTISGTTTSVYFGGGAIFVISDNGSASITNSGNATAASNGGDAIALDAEGNVSSTLVNSANLTATSTLSYAADLFVNVFNRGAAALSVTNSGTGTSTGSYAYGIAAYGYTGSSVTINNHGHLTATGTNTGSAIYASTSDGPIVITNTAAVTGAGTGTSSGIYAIAQGSGTVIITNSATGSATGNSTSSNNNTFGIVGYADSGSLTINNDGTASGIDTHGGTASGIYASSNGATVVNNNGTAIGSTSGIYLETSGTVNDAGTVSGGVNSIFVQTASTVHLTGSSPLQGLIKGGTDDTSTSLLDFNLTVRSGYAQAKAALDAAIAAYDAAYATAGKGPGNDVTSSVVVINGSDYQWQDFQTVEDNLIQGRLYANTPGYRSEGTVLDNLNTANAQAAVILNALGNVSNANLGAALAELSPKELQIFRNIAFDNNTFNSTQINNHLANLRDGLTGFDSSGLAIQDSSLDSTLSQVNSHLLAYNPASTPGLISDSTEAIFGGTDSKDMKSMEVNTMPTERWSSFISGDVILADLSPNANLEDSDYTTGSVTAGVDYRLDQHFTVGALFAYAHTDANLDHRGSSATVDSYSPGLYASYVDGGWYGNGLATYGRNAYTDDRHIDLAGLGGDNHGGTSGNQGDVNLTGGYEFHQGAFKFGPVASAEYVHLQIDPLQEQGLTSLSIHNQNQDSFRSLLGFEGRFETNVSTPLGPVTLTPHASASWQHEYLDNSGGITSQFNGAGGGSFNTPTDSPDRDSAFFDVGLDATVNKNVTVFVDYEAQAGQQNFFAQSAQGGVKIGF